MVLMLIETGGNYPDTFINHIKKGCLKRYETTPFFDIHFYIMWSNIYAAAGLHSGEATFADGFSDDLINIFHHNGKAHLSIHV